ncbi:MAG: pilin [Patescibacteria group bacterium]|jgi:hypothetical protein
MKLFSVPFRSGVVACVVLCGIGFFAMDASAKLCQDVAKETYGVGKYTSSGCMAKQKSCDDAKGVVLKGAEDDCTGTAVCCVQGVAAPAAGTIGAEGKPSPGAAPALIDPLGAGTTLYTIINRIIRAFLGMVGALAFAVFVYSGIVWMTAGSSERVQHAKDAMKYAVIGLLMIGFSFAITNFIIDALVRQPTAVETPVQEAVPLGE